MASVSYNVAVRISNMLGNVSPEYVMSEQFTDAQANDAIMMISAGESERIDAIITSGPVVDWDLINTQLAAADAERAPSGILGGLARKASLVFWVALAIGGAYAYSLVKK